MVAAVTDDSKPVLVEVIRSTVVVVVKEGFAGAVASVKVGSSIRFLNNRFRFELSIAVELEDELAGHQLQSGHQ